jgi:hypothetical protein
MGIQITGRFFSLHTMGGIPLRMDKETISKIFLKKINFEG